MTEGNSLHDRINNIWHKILNKFLGSRANSKTAAIIICLLVSTLFWLLISLNDDYSTEVELPIEFYNIPKNYTFYENPPNSVVATIEDDGFTIMRYKFSFVFSALKFDVSNYFEKNIIKNDGDITVNKASLINSISSVFLSKTKITNVFPEEIVIPFSKLQEKKLPIQVMADITTENQHIVNGNIIIEPDSVLVVGSGKLLNDYKVIYTKPIRAIDLKDTLIRKVYLQEIKGLDYFIDEVKLTIPVELYTEKVLQVPVVGEDFPDSLNIRTFPGVVEVSCICGLSTYREVQPFDFKCYIDYKNVEGKNNGNAKLEIVSSSKYAQRVILRTQSVDYLIEKR